MGSRKRVKTVAIGGSVNATPVIPKGREQQTMMNKQGARRFTAHPTPTVHLPNIVESVLPGPVVGNSSVVIIIMEQKYKR
ncbi:hypothetical protein F2P81_001772 [Scophthalmus maximus]|uniref:Uncharacterized protein n=1 Tax=Scophthalmus maximus TaxID=52904 RepID=A0A6A4TH33_SCOMX|nr:hypothetical protein F2P81_001772 [Scophthalmus maximus]